MKNRLFLSVAAATLIVSSGLSFAQAPAGSAPAAGGAAPAERTAPAGGGASGATGGGAASERAAPTGGAMNREGAEPRQGGAQSTQSNDAPGAKGDAKGGMNKNADTKNGAAKDMNRNADSKDGAKDGVKDTNKNAQTKDEADKSKTTGQAAAGGNQLTTEQRTKVTTVIKQQNVTPVTNINFSITVGTRVPRDVRFNPLPAEIITVYPGWRGYEFFLTGNEIIVVNPRTLEIVAVLPA